MNGSGLDNIGKTISSILEFIQFVCDILQICYAIELLIDTFNQMCKASASLHICKE
jgi:hypothetical protein